MGQGHPTPSPITPQKEKKSEFPETYVEEFHNLERVRKTSYRQLGKTGLMVSKLGYGGSALGNIYGDTDEKEFLESVVLAIKSGINFIDVAPWYGYGKAERVLGQALKQIPRNAYYIATKVGRYVEDVFDQFDFSRERTLKSIDESLERLGLEYVDLIQVHDMEFAPSLSIIIDETLPALMEAKKKGKVKHIGIAGYPLGNFPLVIQDAERKSLEVETILSYCHYTLFNTELENHLDFFGEKKIGVINASPLGMGLLTSNGSPSWHPAPDKIKQACRAAAQECESKGIDLSRLGLSYAINDKRIPTTHISMPTTKLVESNLELMWSGLNEDETQMLTDLLKKFQQLNNQNWEGVEVRRYWDKLQTKVDRGNLLLTQKRTSERKKKETQVVNQTNQPNQQRTKRVRVE